MMPRSLPRGNRHPHTFPVIGTPRLGGLSSYPRVSGLRLRPLNWCSGSLFEKISDLWSFVATFARTVRRQRTLFSKVLTAHHVHADPKHPRRRQKPFGEGPTEMSRGIRNPSRHNVRVFKPRPSNSKNVSLYSDCRSGAAPSAESCIFRPSEAGYDEEAARARLWVSEHFR
jgi:hypothetical protein